MPQQCQMPGCKNKGIKTIKKDGIFAGVHLNDVEICTCAKHTKKDVLAELEKVGEEKVSVLLDVNPFAQVNFLTKSA